MKEVDAGHGAAAHVGGYLAAAKESIDNLFGPGYAAGHPELVAAFIESCAREQLNVVLQHSFGDKVAGIGEGLVAIANSMPIVGIGS